MKSLPPSFSLRRSLFTAAAFAVLAATSGVPAAHAAPPRTVTRASERDWLYDLHDFDDAPRPAGFFENGWSARTAAAPASAPAFTAASTGAQPNAVLVPPGDNNYSRGRAVAISGGTALVASNVNNTALNSAVYVYQGVGTATGSVSQSAQLTSADGQAGQAGDNFGISVSLAGGLGIVGAPTFPNQGYVPKVYVYNNLATATGNVTESAQLRPSDSTFSNNQFGFSTSLSGTSGLVGSYQATIPSSVFVGEAYLYRNLNTASGTITENVRLTPSDQAANGTNSNGGRFGIAVSLSGNTGLVGAPFTAVNGSSYVGAAYVFRNLNTASGTITESVKLTPSDGVAGTGATTGSQFGSAVSLSGNIALVGATQGTAATAPQGAAYVFRNLDTATGTVTQNVKLTASDGATNNQFGFSVGLSGTTALVGAPMTASLSSTTSPQGAAYLFRNLDTATGTVTQNVKLFATNGAAGDRFGYAISVDGDRFVISAPQFQTSQAGQSYSGSLGSVSTLDLGNTSALISGISFVSQDNWVVGQNTSGNQVTLSAGDSATVQATGKGVFIGQNAGSNNNTLVVLGTVNANTINIGATGNTGNTLQLGNGGTVGSLPTTTTINNSGVLAFNRSNAVVQGTDFSGAALTGTGGVTQLGTGTTTLNAANTYTGPTTVSAGTLQAGVASVPGVSGAFGNNSAVTMGNVSGATLNLNNFNTQIGSLTGGGTTGGNVTLGTATLTVGGNTSPAAYAGSISGTGGLTKSGTGLLTLAGSNAYAGATLVNGGTLAVNGALTGVGMVTVLGGATLAGSGTIAGAVMLPGGTFSPGLAGAGRLTLQSSLSLAGAVTASFTLASTGSTQAAVAGAVNLGSTSLTLNLATGFTPAAGTKFYLLDETGTQVAVTGTFANAPTTGSTFTQNGVTYQINYLDHDPADPSNALLNDVSVTVLPVPEPGTWALLGVGAGVLGFVTLRRRVVRA